MKHLDCTTQEVTDKQTWDPLEHKYWQHTWEYGELQAASGRQVSRVQIQKQANHTVVAYFQMVTYPLFGRMTISYIPYGPVILNDSTQTQEAITNYLRAYAKNNHSIFIRTESNTAHMSYRRVPLWAYRTSFHQPRGEAHMDLSSGCEQIRANFSRSTRRNISKAHSNNLEFHTYTGQDMRNHYHSFIEINRANTHAHGTTTHSDKYFQTIFKLLSQNKHNFVSVVSHDGKVLAMNIYVIFGDRAYCPFGASTLEGKKLGAYYYIKEQSIAHLCSQDISHFNWGGLAIGKNDDNLKGLNSFKTAFGTEIHTHGDLYDLTYSNWYPFYMIRTFIKHLTYRLKTKTHTP